MNMKKNKVKTLIGKRSQLYRRLFKIRDILPGAVLKDNQENLLESALAQKKVTSPVIEIEADEEKLKLWDFGEVFWDTADQDVRVIWADREVWEKERVGKKGKR
jgi:hypothetical protein